MEISPTSEFATVREPIPISLIGDRYLIFDIDAVSYLRRVHHVCGTSIGTLPQIPQQNLFLGLPMELMKEEAQLLIEMKAAYIFSDTHLHEERYGICNDRERKKYVEYLKLQGLEVCQMFQTAQRERAKQALAKMSLKQCKKDTFSENPGTKENLVNSLGNSISNDALGLKPDSNNSGVALTLKSAEPYAITPTTSYLKCTYNPSHLLNLVVPSSYVLYKHLHNNGYFILPGLRFGCDYNVYPGDPLRYHSHFIAVGYDWEQDIPIFNIIGGGRLGTAVKKGFLMGGLDPMSSQVRTFSIEWAGM